MIITLHQFIELIRHLDRYSTPKPRVDITSSPHLPRHNAAYWLATSLLPGTGERSPPGKKGEAVRASLVLHIGPQSNLMLTECCAVDSLLPGLILKPCLQSCRGRSTCFLGTERFQQYLFNPLLCLREAVKMPPAAHIGSTKSCTPPSPTADITIKPALLVRGCISERHIRFNFHQALTCPLY